MVILFETTSEINLGPFLKGYSLQTTALSFFFLILIAVLAAKHIHDDLSNVLLILATQAKG